ISFTECKIDGLFSYSIRDLYTFLRYLDFVDIEFDDEWIRRAAEQRVLLDLVLSNFHLQDEAILLAIVMVEKLNGFTIEPFASNLLLVEVFSGSILSIDGFSKLRSKLELEMRVHPFKTL